MSAVMVALAIWGMVCFGGRDKDIPVQMLRWRTRPVLFTELAASDAFGSLCPGCARTAAGHLDLGIGDGATGCASSTIRARSLTPNLDVCRRLSGGVAAAVFTAGALRFVFLAARPQCAPDYPTPPGATTVTCAEGFPAVNVLLYGATFAVVGLAIAVPLVASWRRCALEWVATHVPRQSPATPRTGFRSVIGSASFFISISRFS